MGHRLSKIYTRTGDAGTTGLGDGSRTSKNSARVAAMGDIDELNSLLGVILCEELPADIRELFTGIQHDLFDLGGEISIPGATLLKATQPARLEAAIDRYNADLGPLKEFILPGAGVPLPPSPLPEGGDDGSRTVSAPGDELRGSGRSSAARAAALTHLARTVCRRAERMTVALAAEEAVSDAGRQYLNRLSDLLFVLGRWLNKAAGGGDVLWQKGKNA
ncbi:ATP:cob(I)alamin adenosyltransferase [Sulfuritalea sp.]|uniref:ATP:cob(I)alamin adenosyltransferase n=1 Tax=Sulfuritalea sp. TaxID=2480090 RepID=UPI00286E3295|nr:ATP:cob(I)alamin adenosyltransferase [Sulfuritalea sp.]